MANNRIMLEGNNIRIPVSVGTVSGSPVAMGQVTGVALTARDAAGFATVALDGAFRLSVSLAVTAGGAINYVENANPDLRLTSGAGTLFGYAMAADGATGAKLVNVLLK